MKKKDNTQYFLVSLIGFLVALVGFVFYMGIFSSIELTEKNVGMSSIADNQLTDNNYYTSNYMDDPFLSAVIDEGIVTQRGIGAYNNLNITDPLNVGAENHEDLAKIRAEQKRKLQAILSNENYSLPEPLPGNNRFSISLENAKTYPALKTYLEANNLPDNMPVVKIFDNNKKKTLYILSLEPSS